MLYYGLLIDTLCALSYLPENLYGGTNVFSFGRKCLIWDLPCYMLNLDEDPQGNGLGMWLELLANVPVAVGWRMKTSAIP